MSEPRRVPPQHLNNSDSPSASSPSDKLDREALAIIERAAMEMAGRKPPKLADKPKTEPTAELAPEPITTPADMIATEASPSAAETPSQETEPPKETQATQATIPQELPAQDLSAQELPTDRIDPVEELQRATEFTPAAEPDPPGQTTPELDEKPAEEIKPSGEIKPPADIKLVEQFDPTPIIQPFAPIAPIPMAPVQPAPAAPAFRPMFDDHFRLSFTTVQSAAIVVAILALVLGAFGMAAHGWVTAHDWSCRMGLVTGSCPPAGGPKPLARPEIPT